MNKNNMKSYRFITKKEFKDQSMIRKEFVKDRFYDKNY